MNPPVRFPSATYRCQFHKGFTFKHAVELVPYLHRLGISHLYASPVFRASPGSMHGYDICDHNELNPEVGDQSDFDELVTVLRQHGMGLILDFVPNHMGVAEARNSWWWDVLENGPSSLYARFFDIEWHPLKGALENKVLLPILGEQYGRILEDGKLRIQFADGAFGLDAQGTSLPLDPQSVRPILRRALEMLDPIPDELASIVTALDNLPACTELSPDRCSERAREKGVIRDRLAKLVEAQPHVGEVIEKALSEWNDVSDPLSLDRMDALLSDQSYRLSYWRVAAEEINYRRFFDINTLAAICVELPEVFDATHALLLQWIAEGKVDGVRIDHIDGLAVPAQYLQQLRSRMEAVAQGRPIYLVVEKILGKGEALPADWPVQGTTGYEFGNQAINILLDPASEEPLTACYEKAIDMTLNFREVVYRSKRLIIQVAMASEVNMLGTLLSRLAESHRWYRDFTVNALTTAVREVIACFPVYRSYLVPGTPAGESDVRMIRMALSQARRRNPALEQSVFEFLRHVLIPPPDEAHPVDEELRRPFVLRFQQCTGPIMAKGVEDTAFYVYNRLIALNEVGGYPGSFGTTTDVFHKESAARLADFPHSMLATSTHDTKRSEDVRTRIAALSELPSEWAKAVQRWRTMNRKHKAEIDGDLAPDDNEEYFLYQTLVGCYPLGALSSEARSEFIQRIQDYMLKVLHEAKVNSSWIEPNDAWDQAVRRFVAEILAPHGGNRFLASLEQLTAQVAQLGVVNSLTQTVLKMTVPGVPDFYQGTEIYNFCLVDPDNRRPVDYERLQHLQGGLDDGRVPSDLDWGEDGVKLAIIQKVLVLRRNQPDLFAQGTYEPLSVEGEHRERCLAFERVHQDRSLLVVVPRLTGALGDKPAGSAWKDTRLVPKSKQGAWRCVLSGEQFDSSQPLKVSELLRRLPVAVLLSS